MFRDHFTLWILTCKVFVNRNEELVAQVALLREEITALRKCEEEMIDYQRSHEASTRLACHTCVPQSICGAWHTCSKVLTISKTTRKQCQLDVNSVKCITYQR